MSPNFVFDSLDAPAETRAYSRDHFIHSGQIEHPPEQCLYVHNSLLREEPSGHSFQRRQLRRRDPEEPEIS